jgi:hypothetical protein
MTRSTIQALAALGLLGRRFSTAFLWTVIGISLHHRYH